MMKEFHPIIQEWFLNRFKKATPPQVKGWPLLHQGKHTLIAAPTGSGKTMAAFLVAIDRLVKESLEGRLDNSLQIVYVSPLRALSNDVKKNLEEPLEEIKKLIKERHQKTEVASGERKYTKHRDRTLVQFQ